MKNLKPTPFFYISVMFLLFFKLTGCSDNNTHDFRVPEIISLIREINPSSSSNSYLTLREKNDGGFLVSGSRGYYDTLFVEAALFNLNSSGDTLWTRYYHMEGYNYTFGMCAIQKPDGNILFSGESSGTGQRSLFVATISEQGDWSTAIKIPAGNGTVNVNQLFWMNGQIKFVYELRYSDGMYVENDSDTLYVLTVDEDGIVLNTRKYPDIYCSGQVRSMTDGSFLIPGNSNAYNELRDFQIVKIDANGDISMRESFGSEGFDVALSAEMTHDGKNIIAGYITNSCVSTVYTISSSGETSFKTYADSLHIEKNSIRKTSDGGYLFMNYYLNPDHQFSGGLTRLYLSKLDKDLRVEFTTWIDDIYTKDITGHSYLPTELVETHDGAFAFLNDNLTGGFILMKTVNFN